MNYCKLPAHNKCRMPETGRLPPGWHWCADMKSLIAPGVDGDGTPIAIQVPIMDHPLVGTPLEKEAYRAFQEWEALTKKRSKIDEVWDQLTRLRAKERPLIPAPPERGFLMGNLPQTLTKHISGGIK